MKLVFSLYLPEKNAGLSPVILLHGRTDSKKSWVKLAPQIADRTGREVYALDARNHGESPWSDDIDFNILANDLEEFLDDHDICKAILVGHSLGGRTSIVHALRKPESVEKLIIEDMQTAKYSSFSKKTVQVIMDIMRQSLMTVPLGADEKTATKVIVDYIRCSLPTGSPDSKQDKIFDLDTIPLRKEGNRFVWQANFDVLEKMLMSDSVYEPLTGVYERPAMFLYGTESFFDVEKDETIYDYFPKAKKVPVEGAGHLIHHNYPDEFVKLVVDFINE